MFFIEFSGVLNQLNILSVHFDELLSKIHVKKLQSYCFYLFVQYFKIHTYYTATA